MYSAMDRHVYRSSYRPEEGEVEVQEEGDALCRKRRAGRARVQPVFTGAAAVTPLVLKGFGLKQAVVWSEVLGPPVSMRRRGGRRARP